LLADWNYPSFGRGPPFKFAVFKPITLPDWRAPIARATDSKAGRHT
jgi:hypothetical protein